MNQNQNMNQLLAMIGKKMGKDPNQLQKEFAEGKFDSVLRGLNQADSAKLQMLLQNPQAAQQLINTPQAQQMLKKILGQK